MDRSDVKNIWATNSRELLILLLCTLNFLSTSGQSELDVSFNNLAGREYNIFKSPDVLRNVTTGEIFGMDTILVSDYLFDLDYDIEYTKENPGKSLFTAGSDLWYRHYLNYSDIDQTRLNTKISYEHFLGKKVIAGGLYEFRWSDRIGSSVTGDLLMRSFKYIGNTGNVFLSYTPGEKISLDFFSEYGYKIYYIENTRDPLDHGNLIFNTSMEFRPSQKHDIKVELEAKDRNYTHYHALDSNGWYSKANPLRHFRYYEVKLDYDLKPIRGFLISPSVNLRRRIDMYQDYYSYLSLGGNLRIRYMWDKFYISLFGDYSRTEYDKRLAFTSNPSDPQLVYNYLDFVFAFRYEISRSWEISFKIDSDNRDSNSNLEIFKTRRSYNNYTIIAGIIYTLPRIKW